MSLDPKFAAALALHRFCLGPRRGSIAAIASDPRGALLAELDRPDIGRIIGSNLMTSAQAVRASFEFRAERRARQIVAKREADERQRCGGFRIERHRRSHPRNNDSGAQRQSINAAK